MYVIKHNITFYLIEFNFNDKERMIENLETEIYSRTSYIIINLYFCD